MYSIYNEQKSAVAERFIKILKTKINLQIHGFRIKNCIY